ncbi:MAG TPA: hypothetical protein VEA80_03765 [Vitreimonas sp.]|uniref:hypothetical protein n=1 Tax=Vitreimonas sp. TaxID=3069702 RepID=UPI002D6B09C7|nr:hypothetical protein [Vitreimonas sp.]HYD86567.1 hypothetical protein [Vitreimonas sp.]
MNDDLELADLLGEAPPRGPDPGFRFDVLARVAERNRRRSMAARALRQVAVFFAIGLVFPVVQAAGLDWSSAQPVLIVAGALTAAAATALLTIGGPGLVVSRSRALLRAPLLRV